MDPKFHVIPKDVGIILSEPRRGSVCNNEKTGKVEESDDEEDSQD